MGMKNMGSGSNSSNSIHATLVTDKLHVKHPSLLLDFGIELIVLSISVLSKVLKLLLTLMEQHSGKSLVYAVLTGEVRYAARQLPDHVDVGFDIRAA